MKDLFLICGLGNPGPRYAHTRHNCGFDVIERLREDCLNARARRWMQGEAEEGTLEGHSVILLRPITMMNQSGACVRQYMDFYHLAPSRLLVVYDDIDLTPGRTRMRPGGSAGTHNGMRSILSCLNRQDFPRLRIGIGAPCDGDLITHVLSRPFIPEEQDALKTGLEKAAQSVRLFIRDGLEKAMQYCNT